MIRLIALDIDGTLLDSRWQVPPVNRDAIRRATDAGIEVALVTGAGSISPGRSSSRSTGRSP